MKIAQLNDPGVSEILQCIQLGCVDFPKEQLKVIWIFNNLGYIYLLICGLLL